ncbi:MAG: alpha/beta hydrolase, partial [Rhizobiaceae bacterium]
NGPARLLLIAPAPDFTTLLVEPSLTAAQRDALERTGEVDVADPDGGGGARYSRAFLEDGRANRVIDQPFDAHCPVRILQGADDRVVPVSHALAVAAAFPADDLTMTLVPGGDHRLSRPDDLRLIVAAVEALSG